MFHTDRIPHQTQFYQRTEVLMLPKRQDAVIYSTLHIHSPQLRTHLENAGMRFFPYLIYACVHTAARHPILKRFVMGSRFYTHRQLWISTVIKADKTDEESNAFVKMTFEESMTPADVQAVVDQAIQATRKGTSHGANGLMRGLSLVPSGFFKLVLWIAQKLDEWDLLPNALIREDPLHTGMILANLGSIGGSAVHHHLFNWGTCSIVMTLGTLTDDGHVDIAIAVDERIAEGIGFFKAMETFTSILEHPDEHLR